MRFWFKSPGLDIEKLNRELVIIAASRFVDEPHSTERQDALVWAVKRLREDT